MTSDLLEVRNLAKAYTVSRSLTGRHTKVLRAVDGVSFSLRHRETLALVGESGCGKSTTARLVTRLIEPSAGSIHFDGTDITALSGEPMRYFRRNMQIIFQDPFMSLNPRMTVLQILEEPLIVNGFEDRSERLARVAEVMRQVGLPLEYASRYPHEFSGGQRQRIGIGRALMVKPSLVVCDEPVSALDVSIQAQVVNLLGDLKRQLGLSYLFISHDLAVVKHIADRVAVMYLGKIVEIAPKAEFFARPRHPYSRVLLSAIPRPDPDRKRQRLAVSGDLPNALEPPSGCRFHPRCPFAIERCRTQEPELRVVEPGVKAACHRVGELPWQAEAETVRSLSPGARKRAELYLSRQGRTPPLNSQSSEGP